MFFDFANLAALGSQYGKQTASSPWTLRLVDALSRGCRQAGVGARGI